MPEEKGQQIILMHILEDKYTQFVSIYENGIIKK